MPSAHRNALKRLLANIERRISEAEARLLEATSDDQRTKLVNQLADLHISQKDIKAALIGDNHDRAASEARQQ